MVATKLSIYDKITARICQKLEEGTLPWAKPWNTAHNAPVSVSTGKRYRGINALVLAMQDYSDPRWITYKQAQKVDGQVRKGEKGTPVVLWKWRSDEEMAKLRGKGQNPAPCWARGFTVFNVTQCDDLDTGRLPELQEQQESLDFAPIEECESVVSGWTDCPPIRHQGSAAYYRPSDDTVTMPERSTFHGEEAYYSTLFHELIHSTGHSTRLNRDGMSATARFGSKEYSKEELVAEMGAVFLCGSVGIEALTLDNSAAYCRSWLLKLRADSKLVVHAAQGAQKAAELVLGTTGGE